MSAREMAMDNERRRIAAIAQGRTAFLMEVVDSWPACVVCASPIRLNVDDCRPGMYRACNCAGVLWRLTSTGWEREAS